MNAACDIVAHSFSDYYIFLAYRNSTCLDSITHRFRWSNFLLFSASLRWESYGCFEQILQIYIQVYQVAAIGENGEFIEQSTQSQILAQKQHQHQQKRSMHKFRVIFPHMRIPSLLIAPSLYIRIQHVSPLQSHWPMVTYFMGCYCCGSCILKVVWI